MNLEGWDFDPIIFTEPNRIVAPYSWIGHIPTAFYLIKITKPKVFVELGTHTGNSYFAFCQAVKNESLPTKCYAIDTWQGDEHTAKYEESIYSKVESYNTKTYNDFSFLNKKTFDEALYDFETSSIDILHIDGYHTYEAVKHDFNSWLPKMSDQGIIVFHDTSVRKGNFGVWRLWNEIKSEYPHFSFKHSNGLGILIVGKNASPKIKLLTQNKTQFKFFEKSILFAASLIIGKHEKPTTHTLIPYMSLYYATALDSFSEEKKIQKKSALAQDVAEVTYILPEQTFHKFRFDPTEEPIAITIHQIKTRGTNGEEDIINIDFLSSNCFQKINSTFIFSDADPQISFQLVQTDNNISEITIFYSVLAFPNELPKLILQHSNKDNYISRQITYLDRLITQQLDFFFKSITKNFQENNDIFNLLKTEYIKIYQDNKQLETLYLEKEQIHQQVKKLEVCIEDYEQNNRVLKNKIEKLHNLVEVNQLLENKINQFEKEIQKEKMKSQATLKEYSIVKKKLSSTEADLIKSNQIQKDGKIHIFNLKKENEALKSSISFRLGNLIIDPVAKLLKAFSKTNPNTFGINENYSIKTTCITANNEVFLNGIIESEPIPEKIEIYLSNKLLGTAEIKKKKDKIIFHFRANVINTIHVIRLKSYFKDSFGDERNILVNKGQKAFRWFIDSVERFKSGHIKVSGWAQSHYSELTLKITNNYYDHHQEKITGSRIDVNGAYPEFPYWLPNKISTIVGPWNNGASLEIQLFQENEVLAQIKKEIDPTIRDIPIDDQYKYYINNIETKNRRDQNNQIGKQNIELVLFANSNSDNLAQLSLSKDWQTGLLSQTNINVITPKNSSIADSLPKNLPEIKIWEINKMTNVIEIIKKINENTKSLYTLIIPENYKLSDSALLDINVILNGESDLPYLIYFDEDELSDNGVRMNPQFKPSYSPDRFRNQNYIGSVIAINRNIPYSLFDTSIYSLEDFIIDLILKIEHAGFKIAHYPIIAAHKKQFQPQKKSNSYFIPQSLKNIDPFQIENYLLNEPTPLIEKKPTGFSIIILNKNSPEFIIPLLQTLTSEIKPININYEIIVGDTGTTDQQVLSFYESLEENITVVKGLNYHFGDNYNELINNYSNFEYLGLLNNDIKLKDLSFLPVIEGELANPKHGAIGSLLLYPDDKIQHAGVFFKTHETLGMIPYHRLHGKPLNELHPFIKEEIPAVTGAFLFCRREAFIATGGFDSAYQEEVQDIDLCLKFQKMGLKNLILNLQEIYHIENGTRQKGSENWIDRNYYAWKWFSYLDTSLSE